MAVTLKSDYEVAIRFKDGGNIEKYVPLEDLNSYISTEETADLTTLKALVGTTKTISDFGNKTLTDYVSDQLRQPGVELKLSKVAAGSDDIPETQTGKVVVSPIINPTGTLTHATANVPYSTGAGAVTITALVPGSAAHTTRVDISAPAGNASAALTLSGTYPTNLKIGYALEVSDGVPTTGEANTAYGYYKALINNSTILQHFRVETMTVADTGIMDVTTALMFSGGGAAAPVPLAASGEDIDAVVDEFVSAGSLIYTPTGETIGADITTLWTDVETAGTGLKAVVGTYAGAADIASDLSAAEGDIDDLEAIAAETGAPTMAVAATLTTGAGDSELLWTAQTKGEDGDDLSVQFTVPQTELVVTPTGGITAELEYTGVKGQHPISITYSAGGADHAVAIGVVSKDITLTIGSLCTADELWAAIKPAGAVHGDIDELIANIAKTANWGDGTTVVGTFAKDYLDSTGKTVTVTDGAIEIECEYDGATDLLTTTANDIITAIEAHTGEGETFANNLVTVVATGAGTDVVAEMEAHSHLAGGVDGTAATAGKLRYTADAIWVATTECTVSDSSGWKSAALS